MVQHKRVCLVTPSYAGDFERCRLLVESTKICCSGIDHFVLVDKCDYAQFKMLAGPHTHIIDSRELMAAQFMPVPFMQGWWASASTWPLRGWITQQLRKLAMPTISDHDVFVNVDSDVTFVREFTSDTLFINGRLGLLEVDYQNDELKRWTGLSENLLAIEGHPDVYNYVGMMIPWWRHEVVSLTDRLERMWNRSWQTTLGRCKSFSEYMLYGNFIRKVRGFDDAMHFSDRRPLIQTSWHRDVSCESGLKSLFSDLPEETVGVMVHSKDRIDPENYRMYVRALWDEKPVVTLPTHRQAA